MNGMKRRRTIIRLAILDWARRASNIYFFKKLEKEIMEGKEDIPQGLKPTLILIG
jgi:hypothetical protein